jgi:hypothetical protein
LILITEYGKIVNRMIKKLSRVKENKLVRLKRSSPICRDISPCTMPYRREPYLMAYEHWSAMAYYQRPKSMTGGKGDLG